MKHFQNEKQINGWWGLGTKEASSRRKASVAIIGAILMAMKLMYILILVVDT
jgi:hypothetical protein